MEEFTAFSRLLELLRSQPVLTLFLILGMGYLIGAVRIGSFSLGPVAGVLFAGLFLGHFDFRMSPGAQSVGFALFIFSVGYQAGPRFLEVLKHDGLKYFTLALVIAVTGFTIAVIATKLLSLPPGTSAGLLSGGLTSSPTLAAAQEALRSGQVEPPEGIVADEMIGNVATGYAITYIFGLAGLIAIIKLLPQMLGINLAKESKLLESKDASAPGSKRGKDIAVRAFRVNNEEITKIPARQLKKQYWDKTSVARIKRGEKVIHLEPDDCLQLGDELYIMGPIEFFTETLSKIDIGEEIAPRISTDLITQSAQVVVMNKNVIGKTLQELEITRRFAVVVSRVKRMQLEIPQIIDYKLNRGDIVETFISAGPSLVLAGIIVTITPIFVGYFFGRKVLKIHPVLLFGGITGSMTSGASLSVVTKAANSDIPSLGYTGAYAFANVLLTIAGSIILFF